MFRFDFSNALSEGERLARDLRKSARGLILKDWTLKLLALGITLVLWYGVTGQRAPVTERIAGAHLTFRLPEHFVVSNNPRADVDLTVTGGRQLLDRLRGRDLEVVVNLNEDGPGDHTLLLNSNSVKVALPEGVTLNRIEPNTVKVRLEASIERELPVEVPAAGQLPAGRELYAIRAQPATVRVSGPASRVNALNKVESEPVSLNGHNDNFGLERLRLLLPDEQVDLVDALVKVTFDIGEQRAERTLEGVATRGPEGFKAAPEKAAVTILGPRSVIEQLRAADVEITLNPKDEAAPAPMLNILRPEWANLLTLRAVKPTIFSLTK